MKIFILMWILNMATEFVETKVFPGDFNECLAAAAVIMEDDEKMAAGCVWITHLSSPWMSPDKKA